MSWIGNIFNAIFNNEGLRQEPVEEKVVATKMPVEAPVKVVDLQSMTKRQLEEYGRTLGLELDRRHNKAKLIARLESVQ